jgi:glycosyltransferase involved in cell wall biosynthesis
MAAICLIRQRSFPLDPLLTKSVEALVAAGHDVDVICVGSPSEPAFERSGTVDVHRVRIPQRRGSPVRYVLQYAAFLIAVGLLAARLHLRRRYDLVQVFTLPDVLVFAAAVPRLLGARVLIYLAECTPEMLAMKYGVSERHAAVRLSALVERACIAFADYAVTCTAQMRDRFIERGAPANKIAVILCSADEKTFDPSRFPARPSRSDRFVLTYHGTLEESLGADIAVRAVALLKDEIPGLRLRIFGDGTLRPKLETMIADLGLEDIVTLSQGFVPMPELLEALAATDAGLVPTKRNAYRDLTHSLKMFDLIAMRRPAIVARTRSVEAYFDDSCLQLFDSTDEHDLARAIRELHADPQLGERLVRRATEVGEPYRWVHERKRYLDIVQRFVPMGGTRGGHAVVKTEMVRHR